MPAPLDLPSDVFKKDGRWIRECPNCGDEISHLRRNYCVNSSLRKQVCIKCSNKNNNPSGMHGPVRVAWYNSFKSSSESRGYCWDININFVAELYNIQKGKCFYSGIPIHWSDTGWNHTASIDRIDNNQGYTVDNIQLVHKEINMMRGSLDNSRFIELCNLVADKVKW